MFILETQFLGLSPQHCPGTGWRRAAEAALSSRGSVATLSSRTLAPRAPGGIELRSVVPVPSATSSLHCGFLPAGARYPAAQGDFGGCWTVWGRQGRKFPALLSTCCVPSTCLSLNAQRMLMFSYLELPLVPAMGKLRQEDFLSPGDGDQPELYNKTLSE